MSKAPQSPSPTIGELLKQFAYAFSHVNADHTKQYKVVLDRMAQGRDMDPGQVHSFVSDNLSHLSEKDPRFANTLSEALDEGLDAYRDLIRNIDCGGLTREQVAPALFVHVFAPIAANVLREIAKCSITPELRSWTDAGASPTAAVVQWWLDHNDLTVTAFAKQLAPIWESLKQKRDLKSIEDVLYGWLNQKQFISVKMAFNFFDGHNDIFARWLLLARVWESYWHKLPKQHVDRFRKVWRARLLAKSSKLDLPSLQEELGDIISQDERHLAFLYLLDEAQEIEELCGLHAPKQPGDAQHARSLLNELEANNPLPELSWQLIATKARHHVLMTEHETALTCYSQAFEAARYRNGNMARSLLNEMLIIEAFLGKTKYTHKWKGWAKLMGLTPSVDNALHSYFAKFPLNNHYPEAKPEEFQRKYEQRPTGLLCLDEWDEKPPDYRYPNRKVAGFGSIPKPQLLIYATLNKPSVIQKLIEKGADANQVADDGGSALLCAIQANASECVDLLLPLTSPLTINTATNKRKLTPLYVATDHGDPHLVERLLEAGADPNLCCGEAGVLPLDLAETYCAQHIPRPEDLLNDAVIKSAINHLPTIMQPHAHAFEEDRITSMRNHIANTLANSRYRAVFKDMAEHFMSGEVVQLSDRRKIVSLLLEAGASKT